MSQREFELQGVGDPRLAVHATSALPAWLWSTDGSRVLWANPVGARLFGAANGAALAKKTFGPADTSRRQIAQLAGRLPPTGAMRLERLRGFGAALGRLMTCSCALLVFPDGSHGILIAAAETSGRAMPLIERLQRLVEGIETPIIAFASNGLFVGASEAARALFGFPSFSEAGFDAARSEALANGRVERPIGTGHMVLQRVGTGSDIGLVALIAPGAAPATHPGEPTAESEKQPGPRQPIAADWTAEPTTGETASPAGDTDAAPAESQLAEAPESPAQPASRRRQRPLRFSWQMDTDGRFSLGSDEFTRLIGPRIAAGFGRPWREIAETYGLDPAGRVLEAIATRNAWSGITIYWPVDGGGRLPVELSGLPIDDPTGNFAGYRGLGVCRVLDSLGQLEELRGREPADDLSAPPVHPADTVPTESGHTPAPELPTTSDVVSSVPLGTPASIADDTSLHADLDEPVDMPENVVPFRPLGEPKSPALTAVENNAFDELARQLSARLERDNGETDGAARDQPVNAAPDWLAQPEPPARGESGRDRALLDLLPTGILIYRLDRLLYANPAFLQRIGYDSLHGLEQAGGLDALYVEAGVSWASSTSETGTPVTISASQDSSSPAAATEARLFTISWDGESALALMFSANQSLDQVPDPILAPPERAPAAVQRPIQDLVQELIEEPIQGSTQEPIRQPTPEPAQAGPPPAAGQVGAEDLAAILDTTAEGIVMFDAEGNIHACNRSAEALFGYDGAAFVRHNLADLFAPESLGVVFEYLDSIKHAGVGILLDLGSEVLGRVGQGPNHNGGTIPLSMTMGRTRPDGPNFFAVFRDNSQGTKGESEPPQARQPADRTANSDLANSDLASSSLANGGLANSKVDMLARISHEVRTPLNAILGLAEVMIGERFGPLGNEHYADYTRDIRASGERVIAIINDLLELSRIETGKLDLAFANQNLNEMVESCVSVMQPQANRERIIIRTSLAQALPPVVADGRALRQITLNLIGNSIHLANPAGQVIVSTALSDIGDVVLRVRDTGHGLNDNEIAAALEPFRNPEPSDQASDSSAVNLSLTKALVEANRARFHIKTGGRSGTLIEVVFPHAMARA